MFCSGKRALVGHDQSADQTKKDVLVKKKKRN